MLKDMPCGKEKVVHYDEPAKAAPSFTERLKTGSWFGFAEVDIETPKTLWVKFEEMPPFFFTKQIRDEAVPQHMKDYTARTRRTRGDGKKLVGALSAQKLLLYAPLLHWYVTYGAVITAVHRTIGYQARKIFTWFVVQVTEARRTRDADKSKALLAEVYKLLGSSTYDTTRVQRAWCTRRMRRWWTGPCEVRFLAIWRRWGKPMSCKAGRHAS